MPSSTQVALKFDRSCEGVRAGRKACSPFHKRCPHESVQWLTKRKHQRAKSNIDLAVEPKQKHRCAAHVSSTEDMRAFSSEVIRPAISTRMEKPSHQASVGVHARQVRTFERIAPAAGQSQVLEAVTSAVLVGNDVFDVKGQSRIYALRKPTVFATMACTDSHAISQFAIHTRQAACLRKSRACNFRIAIIRPA